MIKIKNHLKTPLIFWSQYSFSSNYPGTALYHYKSHLVFKFEKNIFECEKYRSESHLTSFIDDMRKYFPSVELFSYECDDAFSIKIKLSDADMIMLKMLLSEDNEITLE